MRKNERWRKIAKEIELNPADDQQLAQTLRLLTQEADSINKVTIPAGYEDHLLRSLRARMPLGAPVRMPEGGIWTRFKNSVSLPQFRIQFGTAIGFALIAIVVGLNVRQQSGGAPESVAEGMLIETAHTADPSSVDSWLNSISDSATLTVGRDLASLTEEMTQGLNQKEQEKILNSFVGVGESEI